MADSSYTVDRVYRAELEQILAGMLVDVRQYVTIREHLKPELFDTTELDLAILASVLNDLATDYPAEVPPFVAVLNAVHQRVAHDEPMRLYMLADEQDVQLGKVPYVGLLYRLKTTQHNATVNFTTLRRFLTERQIVGSLGGLVIDGLDGVMAKLTELGQSQAHISAIGRNTSFVPHPLYYQSEPIVMESTGCAVVDSFGDGGQVVADVNAVLGAYGQGKSTFATDLVVSTAERYRLDRIQGGPHRISIMISYEELPRDLMPRFLSRGAWIRKDRAEQIDTLIASGQLSCTGRLQDYEITMWQMRGIDQISDMVGEVERLEEYRPVVEDHIRVLPLTGPEGRGSPEELQGRIASVLADIPGALVGTVVIDHCLGAVRKQLGDRYGDHLLRQSVSAYPSRVRDAVAIPFNAAVWIMHHYSPSAGARPPYARMDHSDAGESRGFAESLATCICLGNLDPEHNCMAIRRSKSRRRANLQDNFLARLHGGFNWFEDVSDRYSLRLGEGIEERTAMIEEAPYIPVEEPEPVDVAEFDAPFYN